MKRAICIPILVVLATFSAASSATDLTLRSVVIDAGHGGHDPGAVSKNKKYYEKNFTLDISRKLADKIRAAYPGVTVTLTRSDDRFVSLNDRAEIANRKKAQLFISVHINAAPGTSANGYSVHVLGQSSKKDRDLFEYNMNVCKRENSVILLESDYSTKYQGFDPNDEESYIFMQLMQNSYLEQSLVFAQLVADKMQGGPIKYGRGVWQNPFYVLWKTAMPAVLLELGFISNSDDLSKLVSERDSIVERLFDAFSEYKKMYDDTMDGNKGEANTSSNTQKDTGAVSDTAILYGTQIFAGRNLLNRKDKAFLGYDPQIIKVGDVYKYVIGCSGDAETARENYLKIKRQYSNSFMIGIKDGKIFPFAAAK